MSKTGSGNNEIKSQEIPRRFFVGSNSNIEIKDLGEIYLDKDEQVTFLTKDKKGMILLKRLGFTPSINGRLKWRILTALVRNKKNQIYIMVVDKDKKDLFLNIAKRKTKSYSMAKRLPFEQNESWACHSKMRL